MYLGSGRSAATEDFPPSVVTVGESSKGRADGDLFLEVLFLSVVAFNRTGDFPEVRIYRDEFCR
jgi:hypothetical protein